MKRYARLLWFTPLVGLLLFWPAFGQTQHSITITWSASTTTGVKYAVYRATASAGPFTQVATDVATLSYTDTSGTAGTTYYYTVAAVCDSTTTCPSGISGLSAQTPPSAGALFLGSPASPGAAPVATSN